MEEKTDFSNNEEEIVIIKEIGRKAPVDCEKPIPKDIKQDAEEANDELDGGKQKREFSSVDVNNNKKRRKVASQERKKTRPRRKATKNSCLLRTPPRRLRRYRRARPSSPIRFEDYYCKMVRWPNTGRPERPEYPSCMEGVEEYEFASRFDLETVSFSEDSSFSEGDDAEVKCSYEALETSIVPGYLEAVLKFCQTSPALPSALRPDPDKLRQLLRDSCVLQCILRGTTPMMMASYLVSQAAKKWPTNLSMMSDSDLLSGE